MHHRHIELFDNSLVDWFSFLRKDSVKMVDVDVVWLLIKSIRYFGGLPTSIK